MTLVEEIDELLGRQGPAYRPRPAGGALPMSMEMILAILIAVFNNRMAAGWPLLGKLLERFKGRLLQDAAAFGDLVVSGAGVVAAAPSELKALIEQFLTAQRDKASVMMKMVYTLLLQVLPQLLDGIWDKLFESGKVPAVFATFAPAATFTAAAPLPELTEAAAVDAAVIACGISPYEFANAVGGSDEPPPLAA